MTSGIAVGSQLNFCQLDRRNNFEGTCRVTSILQIKTEFGRNAVGRIHDDKAFFDVLAVPAFPMRFPRILPILLAGRRLVIVAGNTSGGIAGSESVVIKYSGAGVPLWTNRGNSGAIDLTVDGNGSVFTTGGGVTPQYSSAGVAAKDGKLLWKEKVASNRTAIIPTPIYHDHLVYVTSGYGAGYGAVRLSRDGDEFRTEVVYANRNLANHHGGGVLVGEHIHGHSDPNGWVCQNL